MTPDATAREKVKKINDALAEARTERTRLQRALDEAKQAASHLDPTDPTSAETAEFKALSKAIEEHGDAYERVSFLDEQKALWLSSIGESAPNGDANRNGSAAPQRAQTWDASRLLADSEQYQAAREAGLFTSRNSFGTVQIGEIAGRDHVVQFLTRRPQGAALPGAPSGNIDSTISYVQPDFRGIVPPALKRLALLDMIPTGTTDSNVVEYVQITGIPLSAAETAEGSLKPQGGISMQDATAPVRTIPEWIKANRQAMNDVAGLATIINTLLPYGVQRRIESQILAGDGSGQNLKGILNTTGVGAPGHTSGDNAADSILRAITTVVLSDSDPNFVTLNPVDWQNLLLIREGATDGSWKGEYLYGSPGMLQAPTIWGLTITTNRVVPANTGLVGDSMGASLLVREGLNVRVSDSDQDDFLRNRVTVLAEARVAFPVWRPSAFAIATLS